MEARYLETRNLGEYLIEIRTSKAEMLQKINPATFARETQLLLAEKIAQKLFEDIEPALMKVLKGESKETEK